MRATTLLGKILGLKKTRILEATFDDLGLVIDVMPTTRVPHCSSCGRRVRAVRDRYEGRRWRHLDLAALRVWLRYTIRRVDCPRCGVVVELVPWAENQSWFTYEFEEQVAYLAQRADKTTLSKLMRISWNTVGAIIQRVLPRHRSADPLDGLTHIGVDELSYRRHHEYVTVIVDHVRGGVVWAHPGKNAVKKTRFVLHKNPWNLSTLEAAKVAEVQKANQPLYRAYMLKETLAAILDGRQVNVARKKLLEWMAWAARSRLGPFKKLARTVRAHLEGILAYVATGLSNGRTEGLNGKIRTITRRSYGFHSARSLIALIFLCCSGITLRPVHR